MKIQTKPRKKRGEVRDSIIKLNEQGKSLSEISRIVARPPSKVQAVLNNVLTNYNKDEGAQSKRRKGGPLKLRAHVVEEILRVAREWSEWRLKDIIKHVEDCCDVHIHENTLRNLLHKHGIRSRGRRKSHCVGNENKKYKIRLDINSLLVMNRKDGKREVKR